MGVESNLQYQNCSSIYMLFANIWDSIALNVYTCLVQWSLSYSKNYFSNVVKTLTHVCECEASKIPLPHGLGILISHYTQNIRHEKYLEVWKAHHRVAQWSQRIPHPTWWQHSSSSAGWAPPLHKYAQKLPSDNFYWTCPSFQVG